MIEVLIIGSNGYIGSRVFDELSSRGIDVIGIDNLRRQDDDPIQTEKYNINYSYQEIPYQILNSAKNIIWLAGHASVPESVADPVGAMQNNFLDLISLVSRLTNGQRFIYASSSSIYSGIGEKLATEKDPSYMPINPYDFTKLAFDAYVHSHKVEVIGLRFGTVNGYSRRLRKELMINSMVRSAVEDGVVNLANPNAHRPILALTDLVGALNAVLDSDIRSGFFNLASFNTSIGAIAGLVSDHFAVPINRLPDTVSFDFAINTSLFKETFGFEFEQQPLHIIRELTSRGC